MKEKQPSTLAGTDSQQAPKQPRESAEDPRKKEAPRQTEETASKLRLQDRARKGYHHDGPGGGYNGF